MLREQQVGGGRQSTDATPSRMMEERAVAAGGGVNYLPRLRRTWPSINPAPRVFAWSPGKCRAGNFRLFHR